jgi:hypothetical protein
LFDWFSFISGDERIVLIQVGVSVMQRSRRPREAPHMKSMQTIKIAFCFLSEQPLQLAGLTIYGKDGSVVKWSPIVGESHKRLNPERKKSPC